MDEEEYPQRPNTKRLGILVILLFVGIVNGRFFPFRNEYNNRLIMLSISLLLAFICITQNSLKKITLFNLFISNALHFLLWRKF